MYTEKAYARRSTAMLNNCSPGEDVTYMSPRMQARLNSASPAQVNPPFSDRQASSTDALGDPLDRGLLIAKEKDGPGVWNRFLFLAPQGDTPVRITLAIMHPLQGG